MSETDLLITKIKSKSKLKLNTNTQIQNAKRHKINNIVNTEYVKLANNSRYFVLGEWSSHNARIVFITPTEIKIYEKDGQFVSGSAIDKTHCPNLLEQLNIGVWKSKTYSYEKLWLVNSNYYYGNYNGNTNNEYSYMSPDIEYDDLLQSYKMYYILIKVNSMKYVSLGFQPFEFSMPDNDEIISISTYGSKSGNQNIKLIGCINTYTLNDGSVDFNHNYYISNDKMKKYNLCSYKNLDVLTEYRGTIERHFINLLIPNPKKILGIKYDFGKITRVYDIIHILETQNIFITVDVTVTVNITVDVTVIP
jgi:hypothetical protein